MKEVTFTAFIYEEDKETASDFFMDYDKEYVIEFAKSHNWDEVVNDITGEIVWEREKFDMFIICYELDGENTWEMVSGEEAMQIRVNELKEELNCEAEDIMVFDKETEL